MSTTRGDTQEHLLADVELEVPAQNPRKNGLHVLLRVKGRNPAARAYLFPCRAPCQAKRLTLPGIPGI